MTPIKRTPSQASPQTHPVLLHPCSPACSPELVKIKPLRPGDPADRMSRARSFLPPPPPSQPRLFSLSTGQWRAHTQGHTAAVSTTRSAKQRWETHAGKSQRGLGKQFSSLPSFLLLPYGSAPLFSPALPLSAAKIASNSEKTSLSPSLAGMKQTTSAAGGLLQHRTPTTTSSIQLCNEA